MTKLELGREDIIFNGGVGGYFEKNCNLKNPLKALQLVSHNENSPKESFQKMKTLMIGVDHLLSNQPYLSQALEETLHFLYWDDLSEGDVG